METKTTKLTIVTKRAGVYKYILFVHPLCFSVRFGFLVHPKSGYCRAFSRYLGYPKFAISKRELGSYIKFFKAGINEYFNSTNRN